MSVPAIASNLSDYPADEPGDSCFFGSEGPDYPDIAAGTPVTLRDSTGATVGVSRLENPGLLFGWGSERPRVYSSSDQFTEDFCVWEFTFEEVESGDDFFSVEVGNRGEVQFSREDLEGGLARLSLGN
jgi:hypothetical protein